MIHLRILLLSILLSGCVFHEKTVRLQWQPSADSIKGYQVNIGDIAPHADWIQANGELEAIRKNLGQPSSNGCDLTESDHSAIIDVLEKTKRPDQWPFLATLSDNENSTLQVKMVGAPMSSDEVTPKNDEERMEQRYRKAIEGSLQLLADIQPDGTPQSFYLTKKQQNVVSMLFGLPDSPISVGDQWHLPIYMIELGNGFIVDQAKRLNNACLIKLEPQNDGDELAHIVYTLYESVEGYYELKPIPNITPPPFGLRATYLAYGVFSVKKGNWLRYAGILEFKGSGQVPINMAKLHLINPVREPLIK
jgi:hypothetical protein